MLPNVKNVKVEIIENNSVIKCICSHRYRTENGKISLRRLNREIQSIADIKKSENMN